MNGTIYLHPREGNVEITARRDLATGEDVEVQIDSDGHGADLVMFLPPSVAVRLVEALGRVDGLTIEAMAE